MAAKQRFDHKHILSMEDLSKADIRLILQTAESLKEISERSIKKVPTLRGKTIVNFFFEPSTRTRISFEIAAKRMSADTFSISASTSSIQKGETLIDTARNLMAMNPDVIIIRHSCAGAPVMLADHIEASVINAGDGIHEHPTQCLLDMMTVKGKKGKIEGLTLAIVGDISHSRVAHSNIIGFSKMGAKVRVCGPATMIPIGIEDMGAEVCSSVEEAIDGVDVVMVLRIQKERQKDPLIPSFREYSSYFGVTKRNIGAAKPDAMIMHPGPMNRGVELDSDLADGSRSVILDQVTNGVAVRMALLYLILGGD
ncbi:MAG: aspartate carbamoyltransferase catalytic subunit [Thermodesulfobacteriota bacterium]|nr:aspartate carbamoyltransferase catalytic subunit [Thermodesulfobacteriota bacterium]